MPGDAPLRRKANLNPGASYERHSRAHSCTTLMYVLRTMQGLQFLVDIWNPRHVHFDRDGTDKRTTSHNLVLAHIATPSTSISMDIVISGEYV